MELPFPENIFDLVTAFETVYFWPDLVQGLRQILSVLKPGGQIMICNESNGENPQDEKWARIIQGMTIYRAAELQSALQQAGFTNIRIDANQKNWLCVQASK